jgi:hypothetical protein
MDPADSAIAGAACPTHAFAKEKGSAETVDAGDVAARIH